MEMLHKGKGKLFQTQYALCFVAATSFPTSPSTYEYHFQSHSQIQEQNLFKVSQI
jgi:hypothetical protein